MDQRYGGPDLHALLARRADPGSLEIDFGDSAKGFVRVNVTDGMTEGSLKLPAEPTRLLLNPQESVLAEVKTERWQ